MNRSGGIVAINDVFIIQLLGDPNFKINENGTVLTRVARTGKVFVNPDTWRIAGRIRSTGYRELGYNGKKLAIHRIVYARFKGNLSEDLVVNHIDGNPLNNHPDNLELGTQSQNNFHRYRVLGKGAVMGNRVLTWDIVRQIRFEKTQGLSHKTLALKYNISKGHVSEIVNNKIWIWGHNYHGGCG